MKKVVLPLFSVDYLKMVPMFYMNDTDRRQDV